MVTKYMWKWLACCLSTQLQNYFFLIESQATLIHMFSCPFFRTNFSLFLKPFHWAVLRSYYPCGYFLTWLLTLLWWHLSTAQSFVSWWAQLYISQSVLFSHITLLPLPVSSCLLGHRPSCEMLTHYPSPSQMVVMTSLTADSWQGFKLLARSKSCPYS